MLCLQYDYHFRYSYLILWIWKSLFWKGLLKARPKLTCITSCFIMWNRVSLYSVSIRTLAFLCSYITLTKVLNVSTQRCLQFIHRQYALEVKQNMTHRNASGQILPSQIRCKGNNKLCYMYSEVPVWYDATGSCCSLVGYSTVQSDRWADLMVP
jgi:hypothetical protein